MNRVEFSVIDTAQDMRRIRAVRAIVFIEEQACPFDEEFDELDEPGAPVIHILGQGSAASGMEPVACARIHLREKAAKFERLAIRKAWRGGGNGHRLVQFLMQTAREQGCDQFILNAQSHLTGFYGHHGFVVNGAGFMEAGIDHRPMIWQPVTETND